MATATLPFAHTIGHDLVWDDHYLLAHIERVQQVGGLAAILSAPFLPQAGTPNTYYRPLVYLTIWLDARVGEGATGWFHFTNLALHAVCTLLVGLLFRRWTQDEMAALVGGLVFAVHPVHVESVAFVSARADLVAALCVLLATLAWDSSRDLARGATSRTGLLVASALAFLAASLSKENSIALPIVLLTWDHCTEARPPARGEVRWMRRNGLWLVLYAVSLAVFLLLRHEAVRPTPRGLAMAAAPLLFWQPGVAALGLLQMLRMLVLPWPHNALYTQQHLSPSILTILGPSATCVILALASKRRSRSLGVIGGVWIAVFLAPTLLIPAGGAITIAERYLYLPSVGFCLALGSLLAAVVRPPKGWHVAVAATAGIVVLTLAWSNFVRARVWQDDLALARDLVRTSPDSALAHDRLGQALLTTKRYREAFDAFFKAVSVEPLNPAYHNDLGISLRRLGQPGLAGTAFRESLRLDPDAVGTRLNLSYACISLRDASCVEEQRTALAILDPQALGVLDRVLALEWR